MSDLESSANPEDYVSGVLLRNVQWAQRLGQLFPQYLPKDKQAPKILWIGCSDSRVQESDAITTLPGTAFVHRNIANQFHLHDDNVLSVFAHAVKRLGVQHIAIVGHEHCGGAIGALRKARPFASEDQLEHHLTLCDSLEDFVHEDQLNDVHDKDSKNPNDAFTRWLTPLINRIRRLALPDEEKAAVKIVIEENVKLQIENITKLEDWIFRHAKKGPVWVHGWVYDVSTGLIRDLKITRKLGEFGNPLPRPREGGV